MMAAELRSVVADMLGSNASANKERIDLDGQDSIREFTVNRTIPTILHGRVSLSSWTVFCEDIDVALQSLGTIQKSCRYLTIAQFLGGFSTFLIIVLPFVVPVHNLENSLRTYIIFLSIPIVMSLLCLVARCKLKSDYDDSLEEVRKICRKKSNERSDIAFYLRDDLLRAKNVVGFLERRPNYIEVIVGERTEAYDIEARRNGFSSVIQYNSETAVAHRLEELEGIRSLIAEKEYKQKKKEILNDI